MASLLGDSPRTLERRCEKGILTSVESERLYPIIRLFRKATEVFESEEEARHGLKRPQMRLGEQVPLEIARLETVAREAERLLVESSTAFRLDGPASSDRFRPLRITSPHGRTY